jgi:hypothetical protein
MHNHVGVVTLSSTSHVDPTDLLLTQVGQPYDEQATYQKTTVQGNVNGRLYPVIIDQSRTIYNVKLLGGCVWAECMSAFRSALRVAPPQA